jgi:ribosomal protein L29
MLTKQEIRQLNAKELAEEGKKTLRELMRTKMDFRNGSTKESHKLKALKIFYARIKTIEKENTKPAQSK